MLFRRRRATAEPVSWNMCSAICTPPTSDQCTRHRATRSLRRRDGLSGFASLSAMSARGSALGPRLVVGRRGGGGLRGATRGGDEIRLFARLGRDRRFGVTDGSFGSSDPIGCRRHRARTGGGAGLQRMIGRQIGIDRLPRRSAFVAPELRRTPAAAGVGG